MPANDIILEALGLLAAVLLLRVAVHAALMRGFRAPRLQHGTVPADLGMPAREVTIPTANGKKLFAWLAPAPSGQPAPAILVMHGWGANASLMLRPVRPLHDAGYALLLLDSRCHGRSEDDDFSSMPRFAEDIERALGWLARQPEVLPGRIALVGHSVGAAAALLVASRRRDIRAVVSVSAFAHPHDVMLRMLAAKRLPYLPVGWYVLRKVQSVIGHRFDDIAPERSIARLDCPVLLAHGRHDETVPFADAERLLSAGRAAGRPVRLLALDDGHEADESLLCHVDVLLDFLGRAFGTGQAAAPAIQPAENIRLV